MINQKLEVNIELLKKYDRPGPRYTSYPTAPYFHEGIKNRDYLKTIQESNKQEPAKGLSLYYHLPFCDTMCYFCGCNMIATHNTKRIDEYIDYLFIEMDLIVPHINKSRSVGQLHWGGGTPTSLSPKQILRLGKKIKKSFEFQNDAEIGVEIDPRGLTSGHMEALSECGFNRCSMGVQDFDLKVQESINRIQSEEITQETIDWARELGFMSINIDLMYGLPNQTVENYSKTLEKVIRMNPDRFAVFNYAHLPSMIKRQRIINEGSLPKPEVKLELLKLSIESLTNAGYKYIGMDHFAKPEDELFKAQGKGTLYRNFQGYSTHAGLDLYAFGMSSISQISNLYVQNHKALKDYYRLLNNKELPAMRGHELSDDDLIRREVIMQLMCHFRLNKKRISELFGIEFDRYFKKSTKGLESFINDALLQINDDEIVISDQGRLVIRNIAMSFDAYLDQGHQKKPQFSRTI